MTRTRQVRSVPAQQGLTVQRMECEHCGLAWNRPQTRGRAPQYCSDACKQAAHRARLGPEEYNRRRRAGEERARLRWKLRGYHYEFDAISARRPLPYRRVMPLLHELADVSPDAGYTAARLYKKASLKWHPDISGGDHKVFQLLQEAYRLAKLAGH